MALSMVRAIELGLPAPDSLEAIRESVARAMVERARDNERVLAYVRVVALSVATAFGFLATVEPSLAGMESYPEQAAFLTLLWTAAAVSLMGALWAGWYHTELRWAVPIFDGVIVVSSVFVLYASLSEDGFPMPMPSLAVASIACALLALTGALRLSKKAAVASTSFAVVAWAGAAQVGDIAILPGIMVGLLILATGLVATRLSLLIRRIIVDEVARMRVARMYRQAYDAVKAREDVLNMVAHDLRNPLGNVKNAAELLQRDPTEEKRARYLHIIQRAYGTMNRLIQDLIDAARIESGSLRLELQVVAVKDVLQQAAEMMGPLAVEHSLTLDTVCADNLPPIFADPDRIGQVLSNLIGNAIKFTPEGGSITLRADRAGAKVRISVSDTGPGIPPEQLAKVFERRWQARDGDRRGLGLGLTIAHAIIDAHGERIQVESVVGKGTEFWFTTPMLLEDSQSGAPKPLAV